MSHEFTAASRAASADELRATLSRLPVLRACALRSLGDAVCRREPAAPSIGPALLVLLEGLSSAAAAQHARSLLRRCCGALPALAEALAGDGALPRLPRLALLHALLEGGGAGWPAEAAEVLRALLRSPEVPCAAAHDAAASAELLRSLRRNGATPPPSWLPEDDPACADLALLLAPPAAEEEGEAAGAGGIGAPHAGWPLASGRSGDAPPSDEVRVPGQALSLIHI